MGHLSAASKLPSIADSVHHQLEAAFRNIDLPPVLAKHYSASASERSESGASPAQWQRVCTSCLHHCVTPLRAGFCRAPCRSLLSIRMKRRQGRPCAHWCSHRVLPRPRLANRGLDWADSGTCTADGCLLVQIRVAMLLGAAAVYLHSYTGRTLAPRPCTTCPDPPEAFLPTAEKMPGGPVTCSMLQDNRRALETD